jgi:hypothetical protein
MSEPEPDEMSEGPNLTPSASSLIALSVIHCHCE